MDSLGFLDVVAVVFLVPADLVDDVGSTGDVIPVGGVDAQVANRGDLLHLAVLDVVDVGLVAAYYCGVLVYGYSVELVALD